MIILDEIARYLRSAKAKQIGRSDLAKQVVAFLFSLMDLAAACDNLVLVYSLASTADTFAEETAELQETMRFRKTRKGVEPFYRYRNLQHRQTARV